MKNTKTKTSLKVTLQPDGITKFEQRWSDIDLKDNNHSIEASERIMLEIIKLPEYKWLLDFVTDHLKKKYCDNCKDRLNMRAKCRDMSSIDVIPFPYCFEKKLEDK